MGVSNFIVRLCFREGATDSDHDEIVSWSQAGGDSRGPLQGIEDNTITPLSLVDSTGEKTSLVDFEPDITRTVKVSTRARALGHVDSDGAFSVGPLCPDSSDLITS